MDRKPCIQQRSEYGHHERQPFAAPSHIKKSNVWIYISGPQPNWSPLSRKITHCTEHQRQSVRLDTEMPVQMRCPTVLLLISLVAYGLCSSNTLQPTPIEFKPEIKAIVPTTAGQIGINPVTLDTGPASDYVAPIGPWSPYIAVQGGGATKWIGSNDYLTETPIPTTVDGKATSTLVKVSGSVDSPTATATDGSYNIPILLGKGLLDERLAIGKKTTSCGGSRRKRQSACALDFAKAAEPLLEKKLYQGAFAGFGASEIAYVVDAIYNDKHDIPNSIQAPGNGKQRPNAGSGNNGGATQGAQASQDNKNGVSAVSSPAPASSTACWVYQGSQPVRSEFDSYTEDETGHGDPPNKRSMRFHKAGDRNQERSNLVRRASNGIRSIGHCATPQGITIAIDGEPNPPQAQPAMWPALGPPKTQWWFVPDIISRGGVSSDGSTCPIAQIVRRGKKDGDDNPGTTPQQYPPPYVKNGPLERKLSLDHVCR